MARIIEKEVLSSDKTHYLKGKIFPDRERKGLLPRCARYVRVHREI